MWQDVSIVLAALLAIGLCVAAAMWLDRRWRRTLLKGTLDALRLQVAQAETWVQTKPTSREAEDNLKRSKLVLETIEGGLTRRLHPLLILRSLTTDLGIELAIAARFKAQADKKL